MGNRSWLQRLRHGADQLIHHPGMELAILVLIIASVVLMVAEMAMPPGSMVRRVLEEVGWGITVVFAIMDLGDSILDSYVFLDNFLWGCEGGSPPSTVPID